MTDRPLQLTFGNPGGDGVPFKGAIANIPSHRDKGIRLYSVGVLPVKEIIGNLSLRLVGIALAILALAPLIGVIHRCIDAKLGFIEQE